ncbi:MAG: SH3 domain-containing protein [Kofleriaceae bacterium]|nr:SH3 domain-containing protein [Kofleriaceae bacterium]
MTPRLMAYLTGCIVLALASSSALAEVVTTNQRTEVHQRAGENSRVVITVKAGQAMTVLNKDGRWVKVRVKGRTGFVPRTTIEGEGDGGDDIQRNTRRRPFVDGRSKGRTFGGEGPEDRVGADATDSAGGDDGADGDDDGADGGEDGEDNPVRKKPKAKPREADAADDEGADGVGDDDGDASGDRSTSEDDDDRIRVTLTSRVVLRADPNKKAAKILKAGPGDRFYLVEKRGKWSLVETEDGDKSGWVLTRMYDAPGYGPRARSLDVSANLGVTLISQTMELTGGSTKFPDRYAISTSSLTLALNGELLQPYKEDYWVGGQLTYAGTKALPGLSYMGTNIPITLHNVNLRGEFGYDFHSKNGMRVIGRLGYHYDAFLVPIDNKATLPAEVFRGPTLGVALDVPQLSDSFSVRASLDTVVAGTRTQTTNLEDGASPSTFGLFLGLLGNYRWKRDLLVNASYDLGYYSNSFGLPIATSKRGHMGTGGSRTDLFHTVSVGVKKAF